MTYIGAFTALGIDMPEYVSINQKDADIVIIDARERGKNGQFGPQVHIEIPKILFSLFVQDINKNFHI